MMSCLRKVYIQGIYATRQICLQRNQNASTAREPNHSTNEPGTLGDTVLLLSSFTSSVLFPGFTFPLLFFNGSGTLSDLAPPGLLSLLKLPLGRISGLVMPNPTVPSLASPSNTVTVGAGLHGPK